MYVDTSASARVLLRASDAALILDALASYDERVTSRLMRTELLRVALREDLLDGVDAILAGFALLPVDDGLLIEAESVPPASVAPLDAIHLATALRLAEAGALDAFMTYDARLAEGARHHGLTVLAPV